MEDKVRRGIKEASKRRNGGVRAPDHPACEDELYISFKYRRTTLGYPCSHYWLIAEFERILDEAYPPESGTDVKKLLQRMVSWLLCQVRILFSAVNI